LTPGLLDAPVAGLDVGASLGRRVRQGRTLTLAQTRDTRGETAADARTSSSVHP